VEPIALLSGIQMPRLSRHVEPKGTLQAARHYIRELVYGANDGIIPTFAVVAGVAGLSSTVILICGAEMLALGGGVAAVAYWSGGLVARLAGS
jgi:hypothetical protein